jgi:predicted transcriptional regulator
MKRLLWWLIAGSRGGANRVSLLRALKERPYNANQLAETLHLDYKTVRHHLKVLADNNVIVASGKDQYGAMWFLSPMMEQHYSEFLEILSQIKLEG